MFKTVTAAIFALTLAISLNASAQQPSVDEVKRMVDKTWKGKISQVNGKTDDKWGNNAGECEIKILSEDKVLIYTSHWRMHRKAILTSSFGHSGKNPSQPVAFGFDNGKFSPDDSNPKAAKDDVSDNGVVRLQWNSANEVEFQWWPSLEAQAGQKSHQPPHVSGKLKR